jgi:hypothetical protein
MRYIEPHFIWTPIMPLAGFDKYPEGSMVKVADKKVLEEFQKTWVFHHKLEDGQLKFAGKTAKVVKRMIFRNGDILVELEGLPGVWHEKCLKPA